MFVSVWEVFSVVLNALPFGFTQALAMAGDAAVFIASMKIESEMPEYRRLSDGGSGAEFTCRFELMEAQPFGRDLRLASLRPRSCDGDINTTVDINSVIPAGALNPALSHYWRFYNLNTTAWVRWPDAQCAG